MSRRLAEDFCHLAFTCGWKARLVRNDGCHRVSIRRHRTEPCVKYRDIAIRRVKAEPSYCFTLDRNHIVYAGRNGCLNWVGQCDNFDSESSHVIPALIRKIDAAMLAGADEVVLWGDGSPTREFLYVEDCAQGLVLAAERYDASDPVNLGAGFEISIRDLAETIRRLMGYAGRFTWDTSQPNGQPRRRLDVTRARERFGFAAEMPFEEGLRRTIAWWRAEGRQRYAGRP